MLLLRPGTAGYASRVSASLHGDLPTGLRVTASGRTSAGVARSGAGMTSRSRAAVVLVAALLSAGCSSEAGEPDALPSLPSTSASPSAAPSSAVPPSAQAETPEGARAFARYWFEVLNRAASTGDTEELRTLSHPACESCTRFADSIDFLYTDGGGIRGGVFTLTAVESPADKGVAEVPVTVVYDVTETEQLNKDGSVRKRIAPLRQVAGEMSIQRVGDGWQVRELVVS
jgi:hypothetical protein